VVRRGFYWRREDSKRVRRYRCLRCRRSFSSSRGSNCFGQKKRRANRWVAALLGNGVSERAAARILKLNRKTVTRKNRLLSLQAREERLEWLDQMRNDSRKVASVQFDEMESFERSKCLPLSMPIVVLPDRKILSFRVGEMPAKGLLAAISRKKYGPRRDERPEMAESLFRELKDVLSEDVEITSDRNPKYPAWVKKSFPQARHKTVKGKRGCVVGQGELKRVVFDPLFAFNHSAAMLRANVNRLFRRTWCTTKRADRLALHMELYVREHNRRVDGLKAKKEMIR
jgi:hypothetical protein